jgi:hypothetical protein
MSGPGVIEAHHVVSPVIDSGVVALLRVGGVERAVGGFLLLGNHRRSQRGAQKDGEHRMRSHEKSPFLWVGDVGDLEIPPS